MSDNYKVGMSEEYLAGLRRAIQELARRSREQQHHEQSNQGGSISDVVSDAPSWRTSRNDYSYQGMPYPR